MATDRNPEVMEMVEEELRQNPDISNKDLKLKAEEIDGDVEDLSGRQFNARYPLQVKRKLSAEEESEADGGRPASGTGESSADGDRESGGGDVSEQTRQEIFSMIEETLSEDPEISNAELQEKAAEIEPSIADLSTRSFHARYPLQVKRRMSADRGEDGEDGGRDEAAEREELRAVVRQTLLDFARDVAGAGDRGEVIEVLTGVDEYVDRVMEEV